MSSGGRTNLANKLKLLIFYCAATEEVNDPDLKARLQARIDELQSDKALAEYAINQVFRDLIAQRDKS